MYENILKVTLTLTFFFNPRKGYASNRRCTHSQECKRLSKCTLKEDLTSTVKTKCCKLYSIERIVYHGYQTCHMLHTGVIIV